MIGRYERSLSRMYPGFFVILLDQSASMIEPKENFDQSKANIVTREVNLILEEMISKCRRDEFTGRVHNNAYVCVLGYNDTTYPLLHPQEILDMDTLDQNAWTKFTDTEDVYDEYGRHEGTETTEHRAWIVPKYEGNTEMALAFHYVERIMKQWLQAPPQANQKPRQECFPPVFIHITDAKNNGKGDTRQIIERIRKLHTNEGNVLVCNYHINHESRESCLFPRDIDQIRALHLGKEKFMFAELMFEMSSVIPEALRARASQVMATQIEPGARCLAYNAEPDKLLKFLYWGTLTRFQRK